MSYIGNDWQAQAANMLKALAAHPDYADKLDLKVQVAGPNAQKQIQQINATGSLPMPSSSTRSRPRR